MSFELSRVVSQASGLREIEEFLTDHEGKSEIAPYEIKTD
jgi:hypothetical protein